MRKIKLTNLLEKLGKALGKNMILELFSDYSGSIKYSLSGIDYVVFENKESFEKEILKLDEQLSIDKEEINIIL